MRGKPPTDPDERALGADEERGRSVSPRQSLISFTRPLLDVGSWPFATFRRTAEFGRCWRYSRRQDALAPEGSVATRRAVYKVQIQSWGPQTDELGVAANGIRRRCER